MARDKGYGSGKPLTANASRTRARVAAGRLTKGKKGGVTNTLKKIAAENPVTGFISGGVSVAKLGKVANSLFDANKFSAAEAVGSRLHAKRLGAFRAGNLSGRSGKTQVANLSPRILDSAQRGRKQSESLFPRAGSVNNVASSRLQRVADTITKRHYDDVAKKGLGHGDAVNMPRAQVLRNLKAKRGIKINRPGGR